MNERKQKGLRFQFGAKYYIGKKCVKGKNFQVLLDTQSDGEVDEFQESTEHIEDPPTEEQAPSQPQGPIMSLNAKTGLQNPHTMRFKALMRNAKAIVLVDSGSTHDFMDLKLVNKLSLAICQQEKLKVIVADGRSLMTNRVYRNVLQKTKGFKFVKDFMLLPLKGCDIVLGIQWLLSLGFITWNLTSLIMQFTRQDDLCTLKGIQPGSVQVMSASQFIKGLPLANQLLCPCTVLMIPTTQLSITTTFSLMPQDLQELLNECKLKKYIGFFYIIYHFFT